MAHSLSRLRKMLFSTCWRSVFNCPYEHVQSISRHPSFMHCILIIIISILFKFCKSDLLEIPMWWLQNKYITGAITKFTARFLPIHIETESGQVGGIEQLVSESWMRLLNILQLSDLHCASREYQERYSAKLDDGVGVHGNRFKMPYRCSWSPDLRSVTSLLALNQFDLNFTSTPQIMRSVMWATGPQGCVALQKLARRDGGR